MHFANWLSQEMQVRRAKCPRCCSSLSGKGRGFFRIHPTLLLRYIIFMETLVLSTSYEPMYRVSWERAMIMWVAGRVEIVEAYADRAIRSVADIFPMPSVIRFIHGVRPYRAGIKFNRDNVFRRDKGRCQYCGCGMTKREATYDHVVPRSLGGKMSWENIVLACRPCNQRKGSRTPKAVGMRLRNVPRRPHSLPSMRDHLGNRDDLPKSWRPFLWQD